MAKTPDLFDTGFATYKRVSIAGNGGAGTVFVVVDEAGKNFALKCLAPTVMSTDKRKRFKNEIEFCRNSNHPNIVQIVDTGAVLWGTTSVPFYVMPLFKGTLRTLIASAKSRADVVQAFINALGGIEYAHSRGVVHRDLKPENILYDEIGDQLVISDFGIAKFEEEELATAVQTKAVQRLASFRYAAPEQRENAATVDPRSDIFAIALMLNELVTRRVPEGVEYRKVGDTEPGLAYLDEVVSKGLQNDPARRYQSIAEMKDHIRALGALHQAQQAVAHAKSLNVPETPSETGFKPLSIVAVDWSDDVLHFILDRDPEIEWQNLVRSGNYNHQSFMGSEPQRLGFRGKRMSLPAPENIAQQVVQYAQGYVKAGNELYARQLQSAIA